MGTIFFTLALKQGNPTVVNVILNIQPVISTIGACLLFSDRLAPRFYLFAAIAILAGVFLSVDHPERIGVSFEQAGLNRGTGFALICALFWGLSTVAGRGVMTGMSLRLASSLRIVVGLFCMTLILLFAGKLHGASLWPAAAQANPATAIGALLLLATVSGGIPLLIYFAGLRLTRASTGRLLRNDADARGGLHHLGILPRCASSASDRRGARPHGRGNDGATRPG